jgi:hypothetical protein
VAHYFLDNRAQPDGAHEIHAVGCKRMASDKRYLGDFPNGDEAVVAARKELWQTGACVRCMTDVHRDHTGGFTQLRFKFTTGRAATV